jgi:outer membrane protein insertion porin family
MGTTPVVDRLLMALLITCAGLAGVATAAHAANDSVEVQLLTQPPAVSQSVNVEMSEGIEIRSVEVTGLNRLDEKTVLAALTIKAGDVLIGNATAKLNDAAESLYNSGWFRGRPELTLDSASGDQALGQTAAVLRVVVAENPQYKGIRISGNTLFSTERLKQEVEGAPGPDGTVAGAKMVVGEVINIKRLVSALDAILQVYQDAGYIGAGIGDYSFLVSGEDEGIVEVKLTEGIVDEVIITGLENTKEGIVRSQITHLRPGSVLERRWLEQDLNQIYNTGLFDSVTPDLQPSLTEGNVKVVLTVDEAQTGQAGFGLGYSTINGLQGSLEYREQNLFGKGKQVGATVMFSRNKPGFELTYTDPYAGGRSFWNVGLFSTHSRQQRNPGLPYESELELDTKGGSFGYGQKLNDYDSWLATFGIADYNYSIRKGDPFRGYSPSERARLSAEGETRKLGLSYTHDTRNNIFSTTRGLMGKVTGEIAGFGGDFNFNKWTFEGREFFELGPGSLGFREKLGMANGDVPIYEEYRLGGVNSIRGVSEDLLTGTHSFLANVEYRVPINDTFGAVAFLDTGWAGESLSGMQNAAGAGIGARLRLPQLGIGSVRLDYAWELAGEDGAGSRFHFFLGEMF